MTWQEGVVFVPNKGDQRIGAVSTLANLADTTADSSIAKRADNANRADSSADDRVSNPAPGLLDSAPADLNSDQLVALLRHQLEQLQRQHAQAGTSPQPERAKFLRPERARSLEPESEPESEKGSRKRGLTLRERSQLMQEKSVQEQEQAARAIVLRALTGSPRTRGQLEHMLQQRGVSEQVSRGLLDRFTEVGLVDDAAFAHAWVKARITTKGLARPVLAQELDAKGVDPEVAHQALQQCEHVDQLRQARQLAQRRQRSCAHKPREVQTRRLVGHLQRKGYSMSVSLQAVRDVLDQLGDTQGGNLAEVDEISNSVSLQGQDRV